MVAKIGPSVGFASVLAVVMLLILKVFQTISLSYGDALPNL